MIEKIKTFDSLISDKTLINTPYDLKTIKEIVDTLVVSVNILIDAHNIIK